MLESYRYRLICFIGIDGSGKTTLSQSIAREFEKRSVDARYSYSKFRPVLSKPFVVLGKHLFLRDDIKEYENYSNSKNVQIQNHSLLAAIYRKIVLWDYYLQIFYKIKLPLRRGKVVICDRYVYDTAINDIPRGNNSKTVIKQHIEEMLDFAPPPDLIFLIDLPESIAFQRKDDTPSLYYLKERREIYRWLSREYKMEVIDGTKSMAEVEAEVKRRLLL